MVNVAKSIASFETTILPPRAPIDDFVETFSESPTDAVNMLTAQEEEGLRLFIGEGNCHFCHFGPLFSNSEFHNIGLGHREWLNDADIGRYDGITKLQNSPFNAAGQWSDSPQGEKALRLPRLTQTSEHLGQYKTPTLRQLTSSAPYMHGGHFDDLQSVIMHYINADETPLYGHMEEIIIPQTWTMDQVDALISFLLLLSNEDG